MRTARDKSSVAHANVLRHAAWDIQVTGHHFRIFFKAGEEWWGVQLEMLVKVWEEKVGK